MKRNIIPNVAVLLLCVSMPMWAQEAAQPGNAAIDQEKGEPAKAGEAGLKANVTFKKVFETNEVNDRAFLDADGNRIYLYYHWGYQDTVMGPVLNPFRRSTLGVIEWQKSEKAKKKSLGEVIPDCGLRDEFIDVLWSIPNRDELLIKDCDRLYVVERDSLSLKKQLGVFTSTQFPAAAVSKNGEYVALVRDEKDLVLFETRDWKIRGEWTPSEWNSPNVEHLRTVGFNADGRILVGVDSRDGSCSLWRLDISLLPSPRELAELMLGIPGQRPQPAVELPVKVHDCRDLGRLSLRSDRSLIAGVYWIGDFRGIRFWNLESGKLETEFPIPVTGYSEFTVLPLIISPDWKFLVSSYLSGDHTELVVFDLQTGDKLYEDRMKNPILPDKLEISRDGRYIFLKRRYQLVIYEVNQPSSPVTSETKLP